MTDNPLTRQPYLVSKRELWFTMTTIVLVLIFIAIVTTITLYRAGPAAKEIYVFPTNTYICTNEFTDNGLEKVCAFKETSPSAVTIPPSATVTQSDTSEHTIQNTEVTK